MVKIFEAPAPVGPAMMDSLHEGQQVGAAAGICNWAGKPTIAAAERVPGCGDPVWVESRMDASTDACAPPRFPSPLSKPDGPISGIRLSDWFHCETHEREPIWIRRSLRTPSSPKTASIE